MRQPHERQPCRLPLAPPTASLDDLRPTHSKREEDHGTRVGKAQGQRRASWPRACQAQPRASHHLTGDQCWDFVGLVVEDSTVQKPTIFLGCVQAFLPADKVLLLRYRTARGGIYTLDLDGGQWVESKRVASQYEGGSCQRACLWPATADQLAHDTHSSHGREAGMLTIKPDKENQNKMRTLKSFFFLTQKCMITEENDICQGDFW